MRYIIFFIISISISSQAIAERDIGSARAIANEYKEWYENRLITAPTVEQLHDYFEVAQAIFPNTLNLPVQEDAKKQWTPPKLTVGKQVKFPNELRFYLPAELDVAILIDENGSPIDTFVINSSNEKFNDLVISNIRSWQFKAALLDGHPSKSVLLVPFHLVLPGSIN